MPTILAHAAVPLALAAGLGRDRVPGWLALAGVAAAMAPDLDVIGFRLGIAYGDPLGHRGASHSLLVAAVVGLLGAAMARLWQESVLPAFLFLFAATASHGLLDMLTDGGHGVALFWPWSDARLFMPARPIEVSPLGLGILSQRGLAVLRSELLWVWLPSAALALAMLLVRLAARRNGGGGRRGR